MANFIFILVALSLLSLALGAEINESDKTTILQYKCPCRCFVGYYEERAAWQCKRKKFINHCEVSDCSKTRKFETRYGSQCCDKAIPSPSPSTTATATPTPTPTSTATASPSRAACPCYCLDRRFKAKKQCHYKPWCKVTPCVANGQRQLSTATRDYGRPRYQREFECCNRHYH